MSGYVPCYRSVAGRLSMPGVAARMRTKPGRNRRSAARIDVRAVAALVLGVQQPPSQARPPGQPRCAAGGAASGFHASRFALASRSLSCTQLAFSLLFAILSPSASLVNSICVFYAVCNEIVIASCIGSGYNNCRLQ